MSQVHDVIDPLVRAHFTIKDFFVEPDDAIEYRVGYEERSKKEFVRLHHELRARGYAARLSGTKEEATLEVHKRQPPKQTSFGIPSLLFLLTASSILFSGWLQVSFFQSVSSAHPFLLVLSAYFLALLGILVFHELAHQYLAKKERAGSPVPYFLPGLPINSPLPTFGAFTLVRDPPVNRDSLFRIALAGPLAGIAFASLVSVLGWMTSIPLSPAQVTQVFGSGNNSLVQQFNPSLLQSGIYSVLVSAGAVAAPPPDYQILTSPVLLAGWVGLVVSFFSLLPAMGMDGGIISESIFGDRRIRLTTYLSVLILLVLDTPNYFLIAILILLVAGRTPVTHTLDEISMVAPRKKALYILVILLAAVSVPLPQNIATFPLG